MKKKSKEISIGERIKEVFDKSNMSISQFAKLLNCERPNVHNIFRRKKIDIDLLLKISNALNHNFIDDLYTKHGLSKTASTPKISLVFEINNIDDKALKILLKTLNQLEIKTIQKIEP